MNKHILFVMRSLDNPDLFTQEEKKENKEYAADAAHAAAYAAALAYAAADVYATAYAAADAAADAADAADAAAADADADVAERWVKEFFIKTGKDRQEYVAEVKRLR